MFYLILRVLAEELESSRITQHEYERALVKLVKCQLAKEPV